LFGGLSILAYRVEKRKEEEKKKARMPYLYRSFPIKETNN